jgi:hypothetical protein
MDTTLSGTTPLELDYGHKICFNRYLEEKFPNGMVSNCSQCHRRAVYNPGNDHHGCGDQHNRLSGYELSLLRRCTDTTQGSLPSCADVIPSECQYDYYGGVLQTDFLWTIADAQDETTKTIQKAFLDALLKQLAQKP